MSRKSYGLLIIGLLSVVAGTDSAAAQTSGKRVFATRESCEISGVLSPGECRNAQANALAELDEKSPRFPSRDECQKEFTQCMIAGFGGRRVEFQPAMRGFEVTLRSIGEKSVTPILYGDGSALGFRPRTVAHPDAGVSHSAREQAQAQWRKAQQARAAAAEAAAKAAANQGRDIPEPEFSAPNLVEKPRAPTKYDLESAEHRRKEIQNAPFVP